MSYPPRPRHAPPWDSSPRPRHQAPPPPPRRREASPERRQLGDAWIAFWTIVAIVGAIAGVIITAEFWPNSLPLSARPGTEADMRAIQRHTKAGAAVLIGGQTK
jgi:hypothetical protein